MTPCARESAPSRCGAPFRRSSSLCLLACAALLAAAFPAAAQYGAPNGEWPSYGGDVGGTKYSGLDQIDSTNFDDLEIAWRWRSADETLDLDALREIHEDLSILNMKVTPLMVGGVVYIVTPLRLAAALDAGTGSVRWIHDRTWSAGRGSPSTPAATARAASPTGPTATRRASSTAAPTATCWPSTPRAASRRADSATTAASTSRRTSRATAGARSTTRATRGSASTRPPSWPTTSS